MLSSFISGASYIWHGFKLLSQPGIKRFVIIPLIINIVLFITLFLVSKHFFAEFSHWLANHLPHWLHWLSSLLWIFFFLGYFLLMLYTFVTLANLVAAPFNSLLAEKVQLYLTGNLHEQRLIDTIRDIPRILGRQIAILGYYLPRAALLFVLFFIPVVQIIAAVLWFLFHAWFMALQYIDYPTDNNRVPLRIVRLQLKQQRGLSLGFGAAVLGVTMIPIVNFFAIPAAVAGATQLWLEKYKQ